MSKSTTCFFYAVVLFPLKLHCNPLLLKTKPGGHHRQTACRLDRTLSSRTSNRVSIHPPPTRRPLVHTGEAGMPRWLQYSRAAMPARVFVCERHHVSMHSGHLPQYLVRHGTPMHRGKRDYFHAVHDRDDKYVPPETTWCRPSIDPSGRIG